jgi:hypothetical protein
MPSYVAVLRVPPRSDMRAVLMLPAPLRRHRWQNVGCMLYRYVEFKCLKEGETKGGDHQTRGSENNRPCAAPDSPSRRSRSFQPESRRS